MVRKFVLASVSQSHGAAGVGRNPGGHVTHAQLQQGQLEQVAQGHVCSGFRYLHGDSHLNRLSHKMKQASGKQDTWQEIGWTNKRGKSTGHRKNMYPIVVCRDKGGKSLRTASVPVWKICQRNILHLWGALEILMEWSRPLECKSPTESLEMPKILEKAGMFSSVFLIRMARCSQELLCRVCSLTEDVSFHLSWASSRDLSQTRAGQWAQEGTVAEQRIGWCWQGLQGLCCSSRLRHCLLLPEDFGMQHSSSGNEHPCNALCKQQSQKSHCTLNRSFKQEQSHVWVFWGLVSFIVWM